jgi:hypothetical protein
MAQVGPLLGGVFGGRQFVTFLGPADMPVGTCLSAE